MLSLTRKTEYALVAITDLAGRRTERVSAREIAERFGVPLPVLMNVLKQLTHNGMVSSTRGAKGGYRLVRSLDEVSLAELIDAIEGPVRLAPCCNTEPRDGNGNCDLEELCPIKDPVRRVHHTLRQFLDRVSLAEFTTDAADEGSECDGNGSSAIALPIAAS